MTNSGTLSNVLALFAVGSGFLCVAQRKFFPKREFHPRWIQQLAEKEGARLDS
jgi:hypothetical protein